MEWPSLATGKAGRERQNLGLDSVKILIARRERELTWVANNIF
jgi:hypothetical protein